MLALSLLVACGSRLDEGEKLAITGAGASGQGGAVGESGDLGSIGPTDASTDASSTAGSGSGGPGATGGGGTGSAGAGSSAAPMAPPGGNGGATDTGVTATEIKVAVLSDRTGPVPGLFESTIRAMQAGPT